VLRLAMPFVVKSYVNRQLNASRDYGGRIGDVDMKLWRGGYRIHHVEIQKKTGGIPVPLFSAREVELSIQRRELFHGAIVGQVIAREPHINIVSGPTDEQTQTGSLVIVLLWVYYSAQILFLGAQFTRACALRFGARPQPAYGAEFISTAANLRTAGRET
jgi:hypothetical protein